MLKQVLVGGSGLRSSEIALGTMTFGDERNWGCSEQTAQNILARFVDAGGTTIDCAPNYADGRGEEIVGRFAKDRRNELIIATKYTAASSTHPLAGGNSRRSMIQSVEASLKRLGTDRIDLFWMHFWDFTTPLDEILRAADDLVSAGKLLYFGLSDTPAWLAARAVTIAEQQRRTPVVAIQLEYNAASRGVERDLLPMADTMDLGCFCWGPMAAGVLSGGDNPQRQNLEKLSPALACARERLLAITAETGYSPQHLALRWLMQSSYGRIPIVGVRTPEQMDETLRVCATPIPEEASAKVEGIAKSGNLFPTPLIRSSYLRKFALGSQEMLIDPVRPRC
ncbi:aryl-alcohol dehydrogenase-like predicted oxidoreductase [Sphingobium wenxiniae]|uniref:Aryl-alcohol dehydrogenase-like predicted oxidoreductase n=2 Tax=Sphingobium wenxiniae (strain DSM 21828 / CGMCC 1.7748 / JZ-1) TaxID=595605 RepID=A0A562K3V5_SPHWJ|nr:aryl-alcohol dehydrogenase-like predicted oxidoreductase [Sphingobium wenxiniae]